MVNAWEDGGPVRDHAGPVEILVSDPIGTCAHLRPILPRSLQRPLASTDGSATPKPIEMGCGSGPIRRGRTVAPLLPRAALSRVTDSRAASSPAPATSRALQRGQPHQETSIKLGCGCGPIAPMRSVVAREDEFFRQRSSGTARLARRLDARRLSISGPYRQRVLTALGPR